MDRENCGLSGNPKRNDERKKMALATALSVAVARMLARRRADRSAHDGTCVGGRPTRVPPTDMAVGWMEGLGMIDELDFDFGLEKTGRHWRGA